MKVHFGLHYHTQPGETLHVLVYREGALANEQKINIPLTATEGDLWKGEIQLLLKQPLRLNYHYEVRVGARIQRREWQLIPRVLELKPAIQNYFLQDTWRDLPKDSWLYTSCMTTVWRRHETPRVTSLPLFKRTLELRVHTTRPEANEQVCLSGSIEALGNWDPAQAKPMYEIAPNEWAVTLDVSQLSFPFEYKFLVRSKQGTEVSWEEKGNRVCGEAVLKDDEVCILSDLRPIFSGGKKFHAAGTEIPLFSLRSNTGCGCGDFGDIPSLVDWAVQTGQRAIQFLPINDTTMTRSWADSSPYRSISVYALHPIYADTRSLPPLSQDVASVFESARADLNATTQLDYEGVLQLKLKRLKYAFEQEGNEVLASTAFRTFFQENEYWLSAYAMFCVLRDRFNTADHSHWPQYVFFAREDARHFCALGAPDEQEVRFWYYVQFVLHTQLLKAAQYAREKGVVLIGDIPLGVSPRGVDVWMDPGFFEPDRRTGTAPDEFSPTGQKWDLVPYNWEALARDGYRWWRRRMLHLAHYFDAYRLDHVQGFFRMWEIPQSATQGILGQFVPSKGFSKKELEKRGFVWHDWFIKPYITSSVVEEIFGVLAEHVEKNYLQLCAENQFELQPQYNSQVKIAQALPIDNPETALLYRGLCELTAEVLFVPDFKMPGVYHPRIDALKTKAFAALPEPQQKIFEKIYDEYCSARQNQLWKEEAIKRLSAVVQGSSMLCCGEDLGVLPTCLPEVAEKLNILRLEIQRMPKTAGAEFADTTSYPYLSVAMPGTHDMSVLRAWWKEDPERTEKFWEQVLKGADPQPAQANHEICEKILLQHLQSPSLLMLAQFQDWTSIDTLLRGTDPEAERVNDPANPQYRWNYRMPIALEDLQVQTSFNEKIKKMILESGR